MGGHRTVRIGIIGAGRIAHAHVRRYRELPWVEIVGAADYVPGKAQAAVDTWGYSGARGFDDYHAFLEQVEMDAVSVCTYNMGHRDPAVAALMAGKHILLEKPMAATLEDARAIMRAVDASGKICMVGFQPHFSTELIAAREVVASGALGHVYYAEAVTHRRWGIPGGSFIQRASAGYGVLVDNGVYALHASLNLMGYPRPTTVSGMLGDFLGKAFTGVGTGPGGPWRANDLEVEEFASGYIRFENGAIMLLKSAWAANLDSLGRSFFLGTKGGMALSPLEVYVNQQFGNLNMTMTPQGLRENDQWFEKIKAFAEAVRDEQPSPIDPHGVFLTNVIMDGIIRSAAAGHEVTVDCSYA